MQYSKLQLKFLKGYQCFQAHLLKHVLTHPENMYTCATCRESLTPRNVSAGETSDAESVKQKDKKVCKTTPPSAAFLTPYLSLPM